MICFEEEKNMNDRDLMENMLNLEKGVCDLYMHGTLEAATPHVHQVFSQSLATSLELQQQIYSEMKARGWYAPEEAQQNSLQSVKMKFSAQQ